MHGYTAACFAIAYYDFFWSHWEWGLMCKGKSHSQMKNKTKEKQFIIKKQHTHTHAFDNHDEGFWAESKMPSVFKSMSQKKGKTRKYWKLESLSKHTCMLTLILQCLCN